VGGLIPSKSMELEGVVSTLPKMAVALRNAL